MNQLSHSTRVLLTEGDADSTLVIFHTQLANSMQRMYQHPALLGVKFLGSLQISLLKFDTMIKQGMFRIGR